MILVRVANSYMLYIAHLQLQIQGWSDITGDLPTDNIQWGYTFLETLVVNQSWKDILCWNLVLCEIGMG